MKNKILLTSALALAISAPAMAADPTPTTVTSTSSCTETTLGTATGPVDIEADWQANTINLTWDANNGTVSGGPKQCTYDGTFTLPNSISRTGYEFAGWLVKNSSTGNVPQCYANINMSINAGFDSEHMRWKPIIDSGITMSLMDLTENSSDLSAGEWAVTFSHGTVKGLSSCHTGAPGLEYAVANKNSVLNGELSETEYLTEYASQAGSEKAAILQQILATEKDSHDVWDLIIRKLSSDIVDTTSGRGGYCYCKVTSYTPTGGEPCTTSSRWMFNPGWDGPWSNEKEDEGCLYYCAVYCAASMAEDELNSFMSGSVYRSSLFGA